MTEIQLAGSVRQSEQRALRILIGENNTDLAMTLQMLLDDEPDMRCVSTVSSAAAVLRALDAPAAEPGDAPNAFILDLSLDDGSSLPLIGILRRRLPQAAIVVFTGHKNELLSAQCVKAGANAVVIKSGEFEELTAALRSAAKQGWVPPGG